MSGLVVKCGIIRSEGLSSTISDQGRIICTNCGSEIDNSVGKQDRKSHIFQDFIGAFCQADKEIHYRWINKDWSIENDPLLRERLPDEPLILPKTTENGLERHYLKTYYWKVENGCQAPVYSEVLWTDFEESKLVLLRPSDTGYLKVNSHGMHAPFIASLLEWLLKENQWNDIAELVNHSILPTREKRIFLRSVSISTPSSIFKMLWTFKRYIPGWNYKRSLGKRSPSMLIQDEIRWTTNRLEGLDKSDQERLIKYGPEPDYWNAWPELWDKKIPLGETLADFGPNMKLLGIYYSETLKLVTDPDLRKGERSWVEVADKLIHWPINMEKGGTVNLNKSQREEHGFVENLKRNLGVAIEKKSSSEDEWKNYLKINLPLCWMLCEENIRIVFETDSTFLTIQDLQETLKVLSPWISSETDGKIFFKFLQPINGQLAPRLKSLETRLKNTKIELIYELKL